MELNKIYRKQYVYAPTAYNSLKANLTELFSGFEGVSTEDGQNQFKIFFDGTAHTHFIKLSTSDNGISITLHSNNSNTENRDYKKICGSDTGSCFSYSFVKTAYGAAFSVLSYTNDNTYSVPDGYIQNFFSVFEDEDGNTVNGFVHSSAPNDDTASSNITICTSMHSTLESIDSSKWFLGAAANHTLLCNVSSYTRNFVAPKLYKKLQTEGSVFGKIRVGGKTLIAGSHLAIEYAEV